MPQHITLSELQSLIKRGIDDAHPLPYWVTAEISELKVNYSGHCYLELVEKGGANHVPKAKISAVIWRSTYGMIASYFGAATGGQTLCAGLKVLVKALVSYHELYGLSLQITDIDPSYTLGDMERQRRQKSWQARRKQERQDLAPARQLQPKERELRYDNIRSARAEEGILRIVLLDATYFQQLDGLRGEQFSSPLLGRVYESLRRRWEADKPVTLAALDGELTAAEADHIAAIAQEPQPRNTAQAALRDYVSIIQQEAAFRTKDPDDLLSIRAKLKEKKGYGGS